jgi:small ligand-binding sensory domain FIST
MKQAVNQFSSATSKKRSWEENVGELTDQLGTPHGSVGILYTSEDLAPFLAKMINQLRLKTRVKDWVSASGYGTISQNEEVFGESASCVMVLDLPLNGYRVFFWKF